jgi:PTH1 family peptidyl-tRNA hydrolase
MLIVGLGNPGRQYADTAHNAGHSFVDRLVRTQGREWEPQPEGFVSSVEFDGLPVVLFKPGAEMNLAGERVQRFLARTARRASDCILVHDDMDIELGVARSKVDGGDGGHKGVRSVIAALGTDSIRRVRIGVRAPGRTGRAKDLVLAGFSGPERALLARGLEQAASATWAMINPARVP